MFGNEVNLTYDQQREVLFSSFNVCLWDFQTEKKQAICSYNRWESLLNKHNFEFLVHRLQMTKNARLSICLRVSILCWIESRTKMFSQLFYCNFFLEMDGKAFVLNYFKRLICHIFVFPSLFLEFLSIQRDKYVFYLLISCWDCHWIPCHFSCMQSDPNSSTSSSFVYVSIHSVLWFQKTAWI